MTAKGLYDEKKSSAKPAANSFAAAAARATRAPRLQGTAPQKEKREKSPSELGEEVLALVLEEDMAKSRQTAGGAAAKNAAANAAAKQQAASYGGGFTTKNTGVRKETAPYGGALAAANAAAKQQTAPYGGGFTAKNTGTRKETAPYSGGAGRAAAQYEPPLYPPPAAGESAAPQALAAAGLDENAIRGARWRDDFSNAMQTIDEMTAPIRATPEWQAQEAAQDLSYAGLDANAQLGLGYGNGLFRLDQKLDAITAPIRATPEWQAVAESQQLSGLGLDTAAQMGYDIGQPIGAWASQLVDDTYLAPGTSFGDYLGDRFKSGMWSGIEGAWNSLIDLGEGAARNDLMMQDFERQQYAFLGEPYAELNRMWTEQVLEGLPQAAEGMRSHKAAEYAQYIDELYGAGGLYRLGGDIASSVGQMVPTILTNVLTGGSGGMAYLYASASGNAAAEARANGADEETALLYGILSGGVEVGTEQLGGGIPGLNKGVLDDWLMGMAQSSTGRAALKYAVNALGEGAEEFISGIAGAYLAKMWNGDERGFWQTLGETLPDAFYEGFVGTLTSALMSLPGSIAEIGDARMSDTALNGIKNGETLSGVQLAEANAAVKALTDSWGENSKWSGNTVQQWEGAKNANLDGLLPQTAQNGAAAQNGLSLPKDFISLPMFDGQKNLLKSIMEPTENNLEAQSNAVIDSATANENEHRVSNQTRSTEQQEKTSSEMNKVDTTKLSWKDRMSVIDGKTILQSNDGKRKYKIPSINEISFSKGPDGVITLFHSIAKAINAKDYRDFIKAFADKNLITKFDTQGNIIEAKPVQIKSDGTTVLISQKGINDFSKKVRGQGSKVCDNVDSIILLDKLIEEGSRVAWAENRKGRINPFTYYQSKFSIDGRNYNVTMHIKNTPINNYYYYHSLEKIEITPPNGTSYHETRRPGPNK